MEVWRTSVQVSLYVQVPREFFYDHLVYALNAVGQENIDTTVDTVQEALEEIPQTGWTETLADILYNAANIGLQAIVLYSE